MTAVPTPPVVKLISRSLQSPPRTILASLTTAWLSDEADTTTPSPLQRAVGSSASSMLKLMGPTASPGCARTVLGGEIIGG